MYSQRYGLDPLLLLEIGTCGDFLVNHGHDLRGLASISYHKLFYDINHVLYHII